MKQSWLIRALVICLSLCLCLSMTACKSGKDVDNSDPASSGISEASLPEESDPKVSGPENSDVSGDTSTGSDVSGNTSGNNSSGNSNTSGNNKTPNNSKTNTSSGASVTTPKPSSGGLDTDTGKKLANDKIVDMKGYKFTILSAFLPTKLSTNSTLFEENLFTRIKEVEKAYSCSITILNSPYPSMENLKTYIVAKKKVADLVELSPYQMVSAAELGYITPWSKCSLIDTGDPRWASSYTNLGYYDGKQYGLQFYRPEEVRYCVVFNKTLLKANGIDPNSIYTMVNNGTWTFDKFQELCVKVTKDTNNDGKTDTFGFCGKPNYVSWGLIGANGGSFIKQSNGKVVANLTDSKIVTALNYYDSWVNTQKIMYTNNANLSANPWNTVDAIDPINYFLEGKCAFMMYESWVLNQQLKPRATFDYGMVPYPKGPNATGYSCNSMNARLMCLTSTNTTYEKTAIIFNALARPVNDQLDWTADVQADYFQKNDTQSIKMYDLCLRNVNFDPAYACDSLANELNGVFAETIFAHKTTPSAGLSAIGNKMDDAINNLFNK